MNLVELPAWMEPILKWFFSISKHPDTVSAVLTEEKKVASPLRQDCILSMKWGTISCTSGQSSTPKACFNCE